MLFPPGGWATRRTYWAGWFGATLGVLLWPLTRFTRLTGYEPASRLARGIVEYILRKTELYRPDGRFYDLIQGHFYARTTTAGGLPHLGILTGKQEYVQLAELVYKHAKEWGTSFGWFPEDLSRLGCETCCIKDMIELGIGLAMHVDANTLPRLNCLHLPTILCGLPAITLSSGPSADSPDGAASTTGSAAGRK